jgi:hypothetical protein
MNDISKRTEQMFRFAELLEAKVRADERELLEALKAKMNDINISKRTFLWRFMNFLGYRRVFYLQSEVYRGCSIFCWVYHPRIPKRDYTQIDSPFINQFYPRKKDALQKNALNQTHLVEKNNKLLAKLKRLNKGE